MSEFDALKEKIRKFVADRDWDQYHTPKNLSMALIAECGELVEHFQWLTLDEACQHSMDPDQREAICDEVADCLAYLLAIANRIDLACSFV